MTEIQEGDLYFCLEQRLVTVRGQVIPLTVKEFEIFALLIQNPKRVFTYEILLDLVWHEDYTYYTFNMINHDDYAPIVCGDRLTIAYQALFAPFIPIWWIGEEWNNPLNLMHPGVMYFNKIDWKALDKPENREFFEDVKRYIGIRRDHADVFELFPDSIRDANMEKVTSVYDKHDNRLQAYARFIPGKAIIVVPNSETEVKMVTVMPDYAHIGLAEEGKLTVTDLYTGKPVVEPGRPVTFTVPVQARDVGVYLLERVE